MPKKNVTIIVSGKVQGVYYRTWTVENARKLNISGWVRNRKDGSVEALFSGTDEQVQKMIKQCWEGPENAQVENIVTKESRETPGEGFFQRASL